MTTGSDRPYDAVLFDLGGTLVDTERLWLDAVEQVAGGLGYRLTANDAPEVVGRALPDTAAHLARIGAVPPALTAAALDATYSARVAAGVEPMPGGLELVAELADEGVPTALVSTASRSVVESIRATALHAARFTMTVAIEDTYRTKPNPDPYMFAAERLGVRPRRCVAIENSPAGVSAAEAAGCLVLVVPTPLPQPIPPARRRVLVSGMAEAASLLREARYASATAG